MAKSSEAILAESDRLHQLAVKFKKEGDRVSSDALNIKVTAMRKRAISKMGRKPKGKGMGAGRVALNSNRPDTSIKLAG